MNIILAMGYGYGDRPKLWLSTESKKLYEKSVAYQIKPGPVTIQRSADEPFTMPEPNDAPIQSSPRHQAVRRRFCGSVENRYKNGITSKHTVAVADPQIGKTGAIFWLIQNGTPEASSNHQSNLDGTGVIVMASIS